MRSSTGQYFIALDHVRALAAFIVFSWHFISANGGHLAPPPVFPLSLLTEGHTGVALFMVLSGYLFAKLLDGKRIVYHQFLWNRALRLLPLLLVVLVLVGVEKYLLGEDIAAYAQQVATGALLPTLPNGGWSITVEFHFYLILPLLLFLKRRWQYALVLFLVAAVGTRFLLYQHLGQIHTLSYGTLVGRVDQFLLGILAFQFRGEIAGRHVLVFLGLLAFAGFFWYFDTLGGFFNNPAYPSPSPIWVLMPTLEGLAYGLLISWYDSSFRHSTGPVSRFIARVGTYSYSIYLLHFFVVFRLAQAMDDYVVDLSNLHLAVLFALVCFPVMVPIGYLSYRFIETPFLRFRTKYTVPQTAFAATSNRGTKG